MPLPRPAPRLAISLAISGIFLLARLAGAGLDAPLAAALIAAMLTPAGGAAGIALSALAAGLAAALWTAGAGGTQTLLAALPAAGNLAMAWHFGRTLRPGREPLIVRYSRADIAPLTPPLAAYGRRLTIAWTVFFLAFAAAGIATLLGAGPPPAPTVALNLLLSAGFFLGEHALRRRLFPALGPVGPRRTLRAILRAEAARHAA